MRSLPRLRTEKFSAVPPVRLKNPLSLETEVMRTSLVPGLLASLLRNYHRGTSSVRLYELGGSTSWRAKLKSVDEKDVTHWQVSGTRRRSWVSSPAETSKRNPFITKTSKHRIF